MMDNFFDQNLIHSETFSSHYPSIVGIHPNFEVPLTQEAIGLMFQSRATNHTQLQMKQLRTK